MSTQRFASPAEALEALLGAMEQQTTLADEVLQLLKGHGATLREHAKRLGELEEAWGDTMLELGLLTRRARLLVNMKAATLTQTCLKCGNEYAKEAGVQLCGPCWIAEGKPERYLRPAEPA